MKGSSTAKFYPSVFSSIRQRVTRQGTSTSKSCSLYDLFFDELQLLNEEPKSTRIWVNEKSLHLQPPMRGPPALLWVNKINTATFQYHTFQEMEESLTFRNGIIYVTSVEHVTERKDKNCVSILIRSNRMQHYAGIYLLQNYSICAGCHPIHHQE